MNRLPSKGSSEQITSGQDRASNGFGARVRPSQADDFALSARMDFLQKQTEPERQAAGLLDDLTLEEEFPKKSIPLRRLLLSTILPALLVPLTIASAVGYYVTQERSQAEMQRQLEGEALLASGTVEQIVAQGQSVVAQLTANPLIFSWAENSARKAETDGLPQLSDEELERRFAATKLLEVNQPFNNYLIQTAEIERLTDIAVTERNGFTIGSIAPTSTFVHTGKTWWQEAKAQNLWVGDPEYDESSDSFGVDVSQAILDPSNGQFMGVIIAQLPSREFYQLVNFLNNAGISGSQQVQLLDISSNVVINTFTTDGVIAPTGPDDVLELIGGESIAGAASQILKLSQAQTVTEQSLNDLATKYSLQNVNVTSSENSDNDSQTSKLLVTFDYQSKRYALSTLQGVDWVAIAQWTLAKSMRQAVACCWSSY